MSPVRQQLDSHIKVITPENIGFEYRVASPYERCVAYLLDMLIGSLIFAVVAVAAVVTFGLAGIWEWGFGLILVSAFLLLWFYGGLFETLWNGQTPGKRAMGLRVVQVDGRPINAMQAVLRNFLRTIDALPAPSHLLGVIAAASTRRYQRLGDLACGTMVISEDRDITRKPPELEVAQVQKFVELLPPKLVPSRSLKRALAQYVDRRRYFGPARRAEIAQHVGSLLVEQYALPADVDQDLLLCALYYRAFHEDSD